MARSKAKVYCCCALMLLGLLALIVCIVVTVRRRFPKHGPCAEGLFSNAAVAADSGKCSQIGRDILKDGGSAVDGAIAALLCTSVINPQSMGIGGGAVFTVMDSSGKVTVINSRETAPRSVDRDLLKSCSGNLADSKWIGVPGELRAYEKAHTLYGKLPWAELFKPTIKLAREGFPIPEVQGQYVLASIPNMKESQPLRKFYSDENGNLLKTGDTVKFEKLADTLETIANQGADAFYTGKIAEDLVRDVQEAGGTLTLQDLAERNVTVRDPWVVPFGEYQMYIPPPPAGAAIVSLILNIMRGYHLNATSLEGEQKTLTYHRYVEALKFANGLKKYIRDPRFNPKQNETAYRFTEERFADHIRSLIMDNQTNKLEYYDITSYLESMGTTHVSVVAEDGSAVSVTSTINRIFGSQVLSPRTGVILNNELADFCGRGENISPGEQPPSSMAPIVLKSPSKMLVIGSTGGSMITTGIASALMHRLWFGKSLKDAISTKVVYVDAENAVKFESKFDKEVIEALKALGHTEKPAAHFYNVVNAVEKINGCIDAVSDKRKHGEAAGY